MLSILPVEKYRTTARAQFLAKLPLPRTQEPAMTALREIIEQRRLSALFQPIIDLKSGEFLGFEGLIRGPADSRCTRRSISSVRPGNKACSWNWKCYRARSCWRISPSSTCPATCSSTSARNP